jgi:hypothetical protein
MIKLKSLLKEMNLQEVPIDTYKTIGDFSRGSSFTSKADRALIAHPVAIQKVKNFFSKVQETLDFYFVNTKEARKYTEKGEVSEEFIFKELNIKPEQLENGEINKDHITVFFTNNKGDERVSMTPWIMAHRFGHVVKNIYPFKHEYVPWLDEKLDAILQTYDVSDPRNTKGIRYGFYDVGEYSSYRKYQLIRKYLCNMLGTFKSARDNNLRNANEFQFECFAQYLNSGTFKVNPLPDYIVTGYSYGRPSKRTARDKDLRDDNIHDLERDLPYYAEQVLTDCVGKIFVM